MEIIENLLRGIEQRDSFYVILCFLVDLSEKIFTILFFAEMLLRIYALGFKVYIRSAFNKFDFAVS